MRWQRPLWQIWPWWRWLWVQNLFGGWVICWCPPKNYHDEYDDDVALGTNPTMLQWPTSYAPPASGPSDQPLSLQGLSNARFPHPDTDPIHDPDPPHPHLHLHPHLHPHAHQSDAQVPRRRQQSPRRGWSFKTTWNKNWNTSQSAPSAGRCVKLKMFCKANGAKAVSPPCTHS